MTEEEKNALKETLKQDAQEVTTSEPTSNSATQTITENGITTTTTRLNDYEFSESTTTSQTNNNTYNVQYSRTIDKQDPNNNMVHTTTVLDIDGKRTDYYKAETTSERYNITSGYQSTTSSTEREETSYRNGNTKYIKTTKQETTTSEYGAVRTALGGQGENVTEHIKTTEEHYDKNGNLKRLEIANETSTPSYSSKTVGYTTYNKDEIKDFIEAQANVYNNYISEFSLESPDFSAYKKGNIETYRHTKQTNNTEIRVDNKGNLTGAIYSNTDGSVVQPLSEEELKKELQKARHEADKRIQKLTEDKYTTIDEYMASVPTANTYNTEISLGAYFDTPLPSNYSEIRDSTEQRYQQQFDNNDKKTTPTSLVAQQYMQNLRNR